MTNMNDVIACFRNTIYCASDCQVEKCPFNKQLTYSITRAAENSDLTLSHADLSGGCDAYVKPVIKDDMPCGNCDMGTYAEMAMLNRTAREFSVLTTEERKKNMPRCKKFDRPCVGAKHFSETIAEIDGEG